MTVKIQIALRGGAEQPVFQFTHVSEAGAGTLLEGENDQWTEVYCHDDECNWNVRVPSDALGLVYVEPIPEEPKP
jgi:hypothetical protein